VAGYGGTDTITLTLPAGPEAKRVALLVVGGLAARLDLTYETLEDLEIAVETALEHVKGAEVSLVLTVDEASVEAAVGPVDRNAVEAELEGGPERMSLGRVLDTVADGYRLVDRDGATWLAVEKNRGGNDRGD
jgi:hypothetical protein